MVCVVDVKGFFASDFCPERNGKNMEVTYRRNLYRSYMCIKGQEEIAEEYELKMLKAEHVPCLLEMEMTEADGEKSYLYDISGKQQIGDYLSGKKMGYEMLWEFLSSVRKLCSVLPDYLLRETGVCLEEEYIYVNLRDGSLSISLIHKRPGVGGSGFHWQTEETLPAAVFNLDTGDTVIIFNGVRQPSQSYHVLIVTDAQLIGCRFAVFAVYIGILHNNHAHFPFGKVFIAPYQPGGDRAVHIA